MIRAGDLVRFTPDDIDQFRSVGLDATSVRTLEDFGAAVAKWCDMLQELRPDVLEKIARAMADARRVELPPKLTVYDGGKTETEIADGVDRIPQFQIEPRQ